jgi:SAM-dependent methyltransferase
MNRETFEVESAVEQTHWWFVVRRRLIRRLIEDMGLGPDAYVLDVGTSTGTNLRLLSELGVKRVIGLDSSHDAIHWCREKGLGEVRYGDVCAMPFDDCTFDLVLATDIIEHVDDDGKALAEIRRVLKPGGATIISVPTFPSLWGLQDEVARHKRRYRRGELLAKLHESGYRCEQGFYFNFLLFVPIWAARQLIRVSRVRLDSENQINTPLLNAVLEKIFALDIRLARRWHPPFGVSYIAIARLADACSTGVAMKGPA